jgi:hypothetical protein
MMEEGKGVAIAILGIVAVIAVTGFVLLYSGATGNVFLSGLPKVYGGVNVGEQFPYLVDRSAGGYPQTAGNPDAIYYPPGYYTEQPVGIALQENAIPQGSSPSGSNSPTSFGRQPYFVPAGQDCWPDGPDMPGYRCPQGTSCITNIRIAEGGGWIPAPEAPCYARPSQV